MRAQGLSLDDDLAYRREFAHITLARCLLARLRRAPDAAAFEALLAFLARLLVMAEAGGRLGHTIELLLLQAQAQASHGDQAQAQALLARSLALAQPQGFVRVFVDEGPFLAALLHASLDAPSLDAPLPHDALSAFARRVLAAFDQPAGGLPVSAPAGGAGHAVQLLSAPQAEPMADLLTEPLSAREVEVLRLLGCELSGPQIAQRLVVSLNTLRTHARHIYDKLGVNSRRAAVRRGHELGLL